MMRFILFTSLLFVTLLWSGGKVPCSAQLVPMSVDSLFKLIDSRNRTIQLKSLHVDNADEGEQIARSRRLPMLNASLSVGYLGNGYLTDRDFSNGMNVRNPHSNNTFALEAMQVIYSGGALSGSIRMAELNTRLAEFDLEQNRQQVRFLLLGWLIDLQCMYNRRQVLDENIMLAQQVLDNMQARYEEGVVLPNDITRYELQLQSLRLQRKKTEETLKTTNYRLANALGFRPSATTIVPKLPFTDDTLAVEAESDWQDRAQASNLSLKRAGLGIDMGKANLRIISAEKRPKISLFAYGKFDSPIVIEVPVLNKNFMYWGFGVSLSYNLSSLYTTNRRQSRARLSILESRKAYDLCMENVQNDVQAAYESYQTAVTELRTQEKNLELARRNYSTVNDRFENGMVLVTDMIDAANVRLSSEIGLQNARTMLLFSYYRLKYTTHTL